jgi:hypothetical protein
MNDSTGKRMVIRARTDHLAVRPDRPFETTDGESV